MRGFCTVVYILRREDAVSSRSGFQLSQQAPPLWRCPPPVGKDSAWHCAGRRACQTHPHKP